MATSAKWEEMSRCHAGGKAVEARSSAMALAMQQHRKSRTEVRYEKESVHINGMCPLLQSAPETL
jgi:hypothetical protein